MQKITRYQPLFLITLFIGTLLFFTIGLGQQEIIRFDSRFYLFAIEMQKYGLSFFPTTYHQPYPDYPATSTAVIVLFANLLGFLNKWVAVFPTAMVAALTAILTYLIGARENKTWGLVAVCFLLLNINFLASARSIALDMYPTLITTLCFYIISSKDKKNAWLALFLIALGFIFRGPIGLVIPTGVICSYYLLDADIKRCLTFGFSAVVILLVCMSALLFLAYHTGGMAFVHDVWRMEVAGRMNEKALPLYFYFVDSLSNYAVSFPLAVLVVIGVVFYSLTRMPTRQIKLLLKFLAWSGVVLIGMSIPGDKKTRYILPMMPAIALLASYPFVAPNNERYFVFLRRLFTIILFLAPTILLAALLICQSVAMHRNMLLPIAYSLVSAILILLQIINVSMYFYSQSKVALVSCILAAVTFVFMYIKVVEPVQQFLDQSRVFIQQIEGLRHKENAKLVFYKEHPDGLPIKYLVNTNDNVDTPIFIEDEQALKQYKVPSYFVTSNEYLAALPKSVVDSYKIIAEGNLGHHSVIVFTNIGS